MKRKILATLLAISLLVPTTTAFASTGKWMETYNYQNKETEWSYYTNGEGYARDWELINCNYYYFYPHNGKMAYSTIIDGYYVNEDGAYAESLPPAIQAILKHDSNFVNNLSANHFIIERGNLYSLVSISGSLPKEEGYFCHITSNNYGDSMGAYFIPDGKDYIYMIPNQGGMPIYKIQNSVAQKIIIWQDTYDRDWR